MKTPGAASTQCLSAVGFALLLLSVILSVVGLKGTWGQATFNVAGIVSGNGDFTLWEVTVQSEVPGIGLALPEVKVDIDSSLCSGDLQGTKLDEVCDKLHGIRVAIKIGLACAVLADFCASLAFASSVARCIRDRMVCAVNVWLLLAGGCAFATSLCAVIALSLALSMPDSDSFKDFASPGAGSVCTGLLLVCSLVGMAFEIACSCSAKAARDMSTGEKANMSKAPHPADENC